MGMRIYLTGQYGRRVELAGYAEELRDAGHAVTSRWLLGPDQRWGSAAIGREAEALAEGESESEAAQAVRRNCADQDWQDINAAGTFIAFTEPPGSTAARGGRHVELGMALAMRRIRLLGSSRRIIVVGPRENFFCYLPEVEWYATWPEALKAIWHVP